MHGFRFRSERGRRPYWKWTARVELKVPCMPKFVMNYGPQWRGVLSSSPILSPLPSIACSFYSASFRASSAWRPWNDGDVLHKLNGQSRYYAASVLDDLSCAWEADLSGKGVKRFKDKKFARNPHDKNERISLFISHMLALGWLRIRSWVANPRILQM